MATATAPARPLAGVTVRGRWLHPGAWWLWAIGLATAASRTTNPVLLLLILAVAGTVVAARRPQAPWSRSFGVFLRIGLIIIAVRVVFQVLLGLPQGNTVLVTLPSVDLPGWMAGVRLGGMVTWSRSSTPSTTGCDLRPCWPASGGILAGLPIPAAQGDARGAL